MNIQWLKSHQFSNKVTGFHKYFTWHLSCLPNTNTLKRIRREYLPAYLLNIWRIARQLLSFSQIIACPGNTQKCLYRAIFENMQVKFCVLKHWKHSFVHSLRKDIFYTKSQCLIKVIRIIFCKVWSMKQCFVDLQQFNKKNDKL